MGQAQLLLIVLGVVLVGIAIVAGIQAYTTNNQKASIDAQTHDIMRVFSDIQTWAQKPTQFGGPADYADIGSASFTTIGYLDATSATVWENVNGIFTLTATPGGEVELQGANADLGTAVHGRLCGITDDDILVAVGTDTAPACPQ